MKKHRLIIFAFAVIGLLYSCDDAIDIRQDAEVNDPNLVYNTVGDLERGVYGVYAVFSPESAIGFTSIFTDEVALGLNNGGQGINDGSYTFQLNAGSAAAENIWGANYSLINFINRILVQAERIKLTIAEGNDEDLTRYNYAVGQLYAMRAYAYFELLTYFSTDLKDDSALGVMLFDFVPDEQYDIFLPRSTNGEVYAFIEADLARADETIDQSPSVETVSGRFVTALRARIATYRGRYQEAITHTGRLVNASGTGLYPLQTTAANYAAIWADNDTAAANAEIIFKLSRVKGDFGIGSFWNTQSSSLNGAPVYEVSRALYNSFAETDIRRGLALVDPTSRIAPNYETVPNYKQDDVLVVNKYPGSVIEDEPLVNDIKIFRISEMYLLRAEAYVGLGNLNGAVNSAQSVLRTLIGKRLNIPPTLVPLPPFTSAQQAYSAILDERRKELCFEGFRYVDIKRLGILAGGRGIERYSRDCSLYNACTLPPTDHRFVMPIPTSELAANPNIRGQQNPGY